MVISMRCEQATVSQSGASYLHTNDNLFLFNVTGGVVFVVATSSGVVEALRESSGSVIWQYLGKAGGSVPITVVQGVVYLASSCNVRCEYCSKYNSLASKRWHITLELHFAHSLQATVTSSRERYRSYCLARWKC